MQELHEDKWLHYYHWFHAKIDLKQTDILEYLFFTDGTRFHLRAYVRSQNSRVWNYGNSHIGNQVHLHFQGLVWSVLFHVSMWLDFSLSRTHLMETCTEITYAICTVLINTKLSYLFHHDLGFMALETLYIKEELLN